MAIGGGLDVGIEVSRLLGSGHVLPPVNACSALTDIGAMK
jgi:hypothetical protein